MRRDTIKNIHPGKKINPQIEAGQLNEWTIADYYNRLMNIATTMFEWKNLPESCNERFLEWALFTQGRCLFFRDETLGYLTLTCTPSAELNIYHNPIKYRAYSIGYDKEYNADDCVIIRNNRNMTPTSETINLFAWRLYNVERSIDNNIRLQKFPVIFKCSENEKFSMTQAFMKYDGNEPFIMGYKGMPLDIECLNTNVPYVADKLNEYKIELMAEAMNFLGITTAFSEKRERIVQGELDAANQQRDVTCNAMLSTRQHAAEKINEKYGLNISVDLRSDVVDSFKDFRDVSRETEEEEDNGGIYNQDN